MTPTFTPTITTIPTTAPTITPTPKQYVLYKVTPVTECGQTSSGYDSDTIAVYEFEGNANDSLGTYNGVSYCAAPIFQTDKAYSGTYSFNNKGTYSYIELPDSLWQYLQGLNEWTIEYWAYNNIATDGRNGVTIGGGWSTSSDTFDNMVNNVSGWGPARYTLAFDFNAVHTHETSGTIADNSYMNWTFYSFEWSGIENKLRFYCNGILQHEYTCDSSCNAFSHFVLGTSHIYVGRLRITSTPSYADWRPENVYIDKLIFSKTLRHGTETLSASGIEIFKSNGDIINKIEPIKNIYNTK